MEGDGAALDGQPAVLVQGLSSTGHGLVRRTSPWGQSEPVSQLLLAGHRPPDRGLSGVVLVRLDDLVGRNVADEAADAADDQTQEDNANQLKYEQEPSAAVRGGIDVSEANRQDGLDY